MGWQGRRQGWKDFYSKAEYDKAHHLYYYEKHKIKFLKDSHDKYVAHPELNRGWALKRKFGISLDDYNAMRQTQEYRCKICDTPEFEQKLCVDHCHRTKRVRGLLCSGCNTGLGKFKDDISILEEAIRYLQNV